MSPLLFWLASAVLRAWCFVSRPHALSCPPRFHLATGVRRDGSFACAQPLVGGDPNRDGTHGTRDESVEPPGTIDGRIWCDEGERPVVTWNGDAVVCGAKGTSV